MSDKKQKRVLGRGLAALYLLSPDINSYLEEFIFHPVIC